MAIVSIPKETLEVRSFVLAEGWYHGRISSCELGVSKKGAPMYILKWFIPSKGDEKLDWIASNFPSKITPFLEATFEIPYADFPDPVVLPEGKHLVGKDYWIYLGITVNQKGNNVNEVTNYSNFKNACPGPVSTSATNLDEELPF